MKKTKLVAIVLAVVLLVGCTAALGEADALRPETVSGVIEALRNSERMKDFAVSWGPSPREDSVVVDLIRYTEEEKARFRAEVLDSPLITFRNPRAGLPARAFVSQPLRVYPPLYGDVAMYTTEQTENSVTVEIRNYTELPLMAGYHYALEFYDNGTWRVIPGVRSFIGLGLIIEPSGTLEFTKSLQDYLHLPLEAGLYRIRKDVNITTWWVDGQEMGYVSRDAHDVVAQFNRK